MKIQCKLCNTLTNHEVLKEESTRFDDDENEVSFFDSYQIIRCKGCESISFRHTSSNTHDEDFETGKPYILEKVYPHRDSETLPIKHYYPAPPNVKRIYRETIDAYNNGMPTLCAAGLRAIIESICNAQGIKDGPVEAILKGGVIGIKRTDDLKGKINGLHEKGFITKKQTDFLHEHRYLGNEALHAVEVPSKPVLKIAIDIINHTLESLYEMDVKAAELLAERLIRKEKAENKKAKKP